MKKKVLIIPVLLALLTGCAQNSQPAPRQNSQPAASGSDHTADYADLPETVKATITMESGGTITVELDEDAAPISAANFLKLVDEGFYDGLTFHRIIPGFMIQGGDPLGTGTGGSDEKIKGEFASNGWDNPISHKRGVISMARSNDPNSASCQFFITNADSDYLDGDYAAFGRVISGMDVVDEISAVPTGANNRPDTPVVISTIRRK